jgi:hypothetical protein
MLKELTDAAAPFKAAPFVRAAALLQKMGREVASNVLVNLAVKDVEQNVEIERSIILCRMLFRSKKGSAFRPPTIGLPRYFGGSDAKDWPLEPIEIVDGVPFMIATGHLIAGYREKPDTYVKYCIEEADWSDTQFAPVTAEVQQKALAKLLASPKWKRPLTVNERAFLESQINFSKK